MATVECPSCRTSNPSEALYCSACGAPTHRSDGDELIGLTVGGRYHLVEKIGQGSAGTLYRAEHVTLRRRMAVKLLHKQLALSDEAVERFRREAITVCEIDNDHIPQVHDFGRTDDERLFFAMEFLDGETLSSVIERDGRVSPERAADILSQIADGLMEAHTLGYVHRDLRPRSIFLTRRRGRQDFVKILDFGLAKLVQPEIDAQRTAMGMTYGDPRYMAPEQARGEATDRRADIYSLGVLGFEMLVGEPPFKGGGTFEVLQKVLDAPVPRVRERRADCPPWLESVIRTALAKRPAERFQTVAQLLDALERKQVLPNQPPMPMQLTSQQASKLAGLKEGPATPARTGPAAPMQVFVSSPSLKPIPVATGAATPAASSTQAMPTVATELRTTVPGQGPGQAPGRANQAAVAGSAAAAPAPRMTMSYPAVKLSRSGTAPGVSEHRQPGANPEPPARTGENKAGAVSDMKLLGERLPPGDAKSVPARSAAAKVAPVAQPASRAAESAAKPKVLIASTTQPRNDPTPRTARAMLEQEVMAWEEAALPVLGSNDLTDSASMSEPAGRAPSADTPVEEMKFAPGAASAASPPAETSATAPRPISAPAIAAMRSMFPGPGGPKSSEPQKAQPVPAVTATTPGAQAPSASTPGVAASSPGVGRSSSGISSSAADVRKSSPGLSSSAADVRKSSPGLSSSAADVRKSSAGIVSSAADLGKSSAGVSSSATDVRKSSAGVSSSATDVRKSSAGIGSSGAEADKTGGRSSASAPAASKTSDRAEATTPMAAAYVPGENRAESARVTAPLQRLAEPAEAAPGAAQQPITSQFATSAAAPAESTPFGVGGVALYNPAEEEDSADATIPHIRSSRDDETPIIGHNTGRAQSAAAPFAATPLGSAGETAAQAKTTDEQAVLSSHDTPKDAVDPARETGAESNWFSTPAASAADTFAPDDGEVAVGRRRTPRWTLAVAAGSVFLIGIVYLASRSPAPSGGADPPAHSTLSPTAGAASTVVVPPAPPPQPPAPTPEVAKTEPATPSPGPEVTPLPVATALAPTLPEKTVPAVAPTRMGVEAKPGTDKPAVVPSPVPVVPVVPEPEVKGTKTAAVATSTATPPEARPIDRPEAKTKAAAERPSAKANPAGKAKPAVDSAKADPERKVAAKLPKEPAPPKAPPEAAAPPAEKKPGEAGALVQSAKKKLEDGEPDAATALFARAVELDPRNAEAIGGLGEAYFEQGNFEAAARHLGKAARLAPRRTGYQELLVQALYKVNKFKDAADACRKLLKLDPSSAKAKQTLELAEKKLGAASN